MPETDDPPGDSFATRLDHLFRTVKDANGRPYSVRRVAAELTRRGCKMSHTHLSNLRQGRTDPRRSTVEALAAFFGKPASFFLADTDDQQQALAYALADPHIKQVAMRLVDAQLSPEGHAAVVAMIEQVKRLEDAARTRRHTRSPREAP